DHPCPVFSATLAIGGSFGTAQRIEPRQHNRLKRDPPERRPRRERLSSAPRAASLKARQGAKVRLTDPRRQQAEEDPRKPRDLLNSIGWGGYSLVFLAGQQAPAAGAELSREAVRREFEKIAPPSGKRNAAPHEPHMALVELTADVFIAG